MSNTNQFVCLESAAAAHHSPPSSVAVIED